MKIEIKQNGNTIQRDSYENKKHSNLVDHYTAQVGRGLIRVFKHTRVAWQDKHLPLACSFASASLSGSVCSCHFLWANSVEQTHPQLGVVFQFRLNTEQSPIHKTVFFKMLWAKTVLLSGLPQLLVLHCWIPLIQFYLPLSFPSFVFQQKCTKKVQNPWSLFH